jgi:hypothetical protein
MKQIINCETGKVIERELNEEELAQQFIDEANIAAARALIKAEAEAKAAQKAALLDRLGITDDEAKLLLA